MRLTAEMLRTGYDFLRSSAPYCRWGMPPGKEVKFLITAAAKVYGDHLLLTDGAHRIRISNQFHGHPYTLLKTLAHEMLHVHQAERELPIEHDAEFMRLWRLVCKHHGFDPLNP